RRCAIRDRVRHDRHHLDTLLLLFADGLSDVPIRTRTLLRTRLLRRLDPFARAARGFRLHRAASLLGRPASLQLGLARLLLVAARFLLGDALGLGFGAARLGFGAALCVLLIPFCLLRGGLPARRIAIA